MGDEHDGGQNGEQTGEGDKPGENHLVALIDTGVPQGDPNVEAAWSVLPAGTADGPDAGGAGAGDGAGGGAPDGAAEGAAGGGVAASAAEAGAGDGGSAGAGAAAGSPWDDSGHGTAMLEAMRGENGGVRVVSVKALDSHGRGTAASVMAAIRVAREAGAEIVNLSLSGPASEENMAMARPIREAAAEGAAVIAAAGNNGADARAYAPANAEGAFAVGAADRGKFDSGLTGEAARLDSSNFGPAVGAYVFAASTSGAAARASGWLSSRLAPGWRSALAADGSVSAGAGGEAPGAGAAGEAPAAGAAGEGLAAAAGTTQYQYLLSATGSSVGSWRSTYSGYGEVWYMFRNFGGYLSTLEEADKLFNEQKVGNVTGNATASAGAHQAVNLAIPSGSTRTSWTDVQKDVGASWTVTGYRRTPWHRDSVGPDWEVSFPAEVTLTVKVLSIEATRVVGEPCTITYMNGKNVMGESAGLTYTDTALKPLSELDQSSCPDAAHGWEFAGWAPSDTATTGLVADGGTVAPSGDVTYHAVYRRAVSVAYEGNGADSGSTGPSEGVQWWTGGAAGAASATLSANGFVRAGYMFAGWAAGPGEGAARYAVGQALTDAALFGQAGRATVYAAWEDAAGGFTYTGGEQTYTVPADGVYRIQAWGASGGGGPSASAAGAEDSGARNTVGAGGYTVGEVRLKAGTVLHVFVGRRGAYTGCGYSAAYNGGSGHTDSVHGSYGGGGMTHVSLTSNVAAGLDDGSGGSWDQSGTLVVAGGGGGMSDNNQWDEDEGGGYSGGGFWASSRGGVVTFAGQTAGAGFARGYGGPENASMDMCHGGAGWMGGNGGTCIGGAGGGTGHLGDQDCLYEGAGSSGPRHSEASDGYDRLPDGATFTGLTAVGPGYAVTGTSARYAADGSNGYVASPAAASAASSGWRYDGFARIQFVSALLRVSFDAGGGEGEMADASLDPADPSASLPACAFSRPGYSFAGWDLGGSSASAALADGAAAADVAALTGSASVTLRAVWAPRGQGFSFTGGVQSVTLQPGDYLLEAWGADGGGAVVNAQLEGARGGQGGYSRGVVSLAAETTLYVAVGGRGADGAVHSYADGGFNGGGRGAPDETSGGDDEGAGGGGGATSISTAGGALASQSGSPGRVALVAGGGGGAAGTRGGGAGGGREGGANDAGGAAGQGSGGAGFGAGGAGSVKQWYGMAGGGGGWRGGLASTTNGVDAPAFAGGGSGRVGGASCSFGADGASAQGSFLLAGGGSVAISGGSWPGGSEAAVASPAAPSGALAARDGYARITRLEVTLTFQGEGGEVRAAGSSGAWAGSVELVRVSGGAVGDLPEARRDGFSFAGWWTAPGGGSQLTPSSPVPEADATYHARWLEVVSYSQVSYAYDGSPRTASAPAGAGWSLSAPAGGTLSRTDAGEYEALATPDSGCCWEGGSTDAKVVTWVIKPYFHAPGPRRGPDLGRRPRLRPRGGKAVRQGRAPRAPQPARPPREPAPELGGRRLPAGRPGGQAGGQAAARRPGRGPRPPPASPIGLRPQPAGGRPPRPPAAPRAGPRPSPGPRGPWAAAACGRPSPAPAGRASPRGPGPSKAGFGPPPWYSSGRRPGVPARSAGRPAYDPNCPSVAATLLSPSSRGFGAACQSGLFASPLGRALGVELPQIASGGRATDRFAASSVQKVGYGLP